LTARGAPDSVDGPVGEAVAPSALRRRLPREESFMQPWMEVNEALDFAIANEEEAHRFYLELAARIDKPWMRELLEGFAQEELGHKAKLEAVRRGGQLAPARGKILDLKIADYAVDVKPTSRLDYAQALLVAMKQEKAAFRLYTDLAGTCEPGPVREMFLALAQEEAKHKLRFELEYDEHVLREN
jgi:rubrerythrin